MKPAPFEYVRAHSKAEALDVLAQHGFEAKVLAGGQSLVPMLNFRVSSAAILVDVNRMSDAVGVDLSGDVLRLGQKARHVDLETNQELAHRFPLFKEVSKHIAHRAIRNRGTFIGSLCHNDPSAEWPLLATLLDAEVEISSGTGARTLPIAEFLTAYLTTDLREGEMVSAVTMSLPSRSTGCGFHEYARRLGDFAMAASAACLTVTEGQIVDARLSLGGVGAFACRDSAAEAMMVGETPSESLWRAVADAACRNCDPTSDLHATAEFRTHLLGQSIERALKMAAERCKTAGEI